MRANGVDVTRQRFGYGGQKRVDLRLSPLQTKYPQRTSAPIDLVKPQRRDFAAAQSVDCKQHQDRTITNVSGCVRPGVRQDPPDIVPAGGIRQRFLLIASRTLYGICQPWIARRL